MFLKLAIAITLVIVCDFVAAKRQIGLVSAPASPEIERTVYALAERDSTESEAAVLKAAKGLEEAILRNNAYEIGSFLDEDWIVVDPDGGIIEKTRFLNVIKSGTLSHQAMNSEDIRVRVYGNTAVMTALTSSKAKYMNNEFSTRERTTDVFVKRDGKWRCVITHLTTLAKK